MDPTVSASLTVCLWCRLWVSLETNHIKSSLIYKLSQRQRGGQTNREREREGQRQRGKQTQMTFTRLIIDSGETYLLPSLSRIYHNESVAVSGLPLMALTVSTKKKWCPGSCFCWINTHCMWYIHTNVCLSSQSFRTLMTLSALPICCSALSNGCEKKQRKSKRLLHAAPVCVRVFEYVVWVFVSVSECIYLFYI